VAIRRIAKLVEYIKELVAEADGCIYLDTLCEPTELYRLIEIYKSKWSYKAVWSTSTAVELSRIEQAEPPVKFLAMWLVYYYVVKRVGGITAAYGTLWFSWSAMCCSGLRWSAMCCSAMCCSAMCCSVEVW
jgi:hypothetical protein